MTDPCNKTGFRPRQARRGALVRQGATACLWVLLAGSASCGNATLDLFDPDLGLLGHWALDEAQAGAIALDSSGFGNHGTSSANPPVPSADAPPVHFQDAHSLSFNGVDQWIQMGNPGLLNLGGVISIAAWVRATAVDDYRNIVAHGYRWEPSYDLSLRIYSGSYQFTSWDSVDHAAIATVPPEDIGTWVHLCGVFDGSAFYLYRNGALAASTAEPTAPAANVDATWAIGARAPQPSGGTDYRYLQGQIDDVRIYGRALSGPEVEALYRR